MEPTAEAALPSAAREEYVAEFVREKLDEIRDRLKHSDRNDLISWRVLLVGTSDQRLERLAWLGLSCLPQKKEDLRDPLLRSLWDALSQEPGLIPHLETKLGTDGEVSAFISVIPEKIAQSLILSRIEAAKEMRTEHDSTFRLFELFPGMHSSILGTPSKFSHLRNRAAKWLWEFLTQHGYTPVIAHDTRMAGPIKIVRHWIAIDLQG